MRRAGLRGTSFVAIAIAVATSVATTRARGDDADDLRALLQESVVAGASKAAETTSDAPATVSVLTHDDMRVFGIRSLNEAIDFLGMGLVTEDPLHSVEIGGRGVLLTSDYGNHVLVLVDGHAINEQWDGTAYFEQGLGMPIELVDHVELILGPGSVLYGGNAMLGVINVVTKSARAYDGWHLVAEGGISPGQRGGSIRSFAPDDAGGFYRLGTGVGATTTALGKPLDVVGQVELYGQSGPSFSWAYQRYNDADGSPASFGPKAPLGLWGGITRDSYSTVVPTGHVRATWGDLTATLHAETYFRTTPYMNGFNQSFGDFDDPRTYELDRWLWGDLRYAHRFGERFSLSARLYGDTYDFQQRLHASDPSWCALTVTGSCDEYILGASRWAGLEVQGTQDWLGDDRLTTLIGVDPRVRWIGAKTDSYDATGRDVGSVGARSATDFPVGVYLQQRWTPVKPVHLNAGARFDDDPRGGRRLSPRAAVAWDAWRGGSLKTIYSEAFRAPTFYEFYYVGTGQIENPGLRSETVRSIEASIEQRFRGQRVLFGVFRSWWTDMIRLEVLDPATQLAQYRNTSSIDNYGFNAMADGSVGALRYGLSMTGAYSRRRAPEGDSPLTVAPQVFGNARVAYDLPGGWPTIALASSLLGPRLADRALDGGFPVLPVAPTSVQLRATVSGDVPAIAGLSYRVSGNYVTASRSAYVAGPNQAFDPTNPQPAELAPINRLTIFATLRYDLFGERW